MENQSLLRDCLRSIREEEEDFLEKISLIETVYLTEIPTLRILDEDLRKCLNLLQEVQLIYTSIHSAIIYKPDPHFLSDTKTGKYVPHDEFDALRAVVSSDGLFSIYESYIPGYQMLRKKLCQVLSDVGMKQKYSECQTKAGITLETILSLPVSHLAFYSDILSRLAALNVAFPPDLTGKVKSFTKGVTDLVHLSNKIPVDAEIVVHSVWDLFGQNEAILANPRRVVLRQGAVMRYGRHGEKPVFLVLFNDALLIGKKDGSRYALLNLFDLLHISVSDFSNGFISHSLGVSTPTKSYIFLFLTLSEKAAWKQDIDQAIYLMSQEFPEQNPPLLSCKNEYCPRKKNIPRDDCAMCSFCGENFCSECIRWYDLLENREATEEAAPSSVAAPSPSSSHSLSSPPPRSSATVVRSCPLCLYRQTDRRNGLTKEPTPQQGLPAYWEAKEGTASSAASGGGPPLYRNVVTNHVIGFHPDLFFELERANREEDTPVTWRRTYTRDGCKFYENLLTGKASWTLEGVEVEDGGKKEEEEEEKKK